MSWGDRFVPQLGLCPWTEGTRTADGQSADMTAVEQTCIRMKTADYCGTGLVHTQYGTQIVVNTPIEKVRHLSAQARLEAIWNEHGAVCVIDNNRRHQNMYYACDASIPQCDKGLHCEVCLVLLCPSGFAVADGFGFRLCSRSQVLPTMFKVKTSMKKSALCSGLFLLFKLAGRVRLGRQSTRTRADQGLYTR